MKLYKEPEYLSYTDLGFVFGYSRSSIMRVVDKLLAAGHKIEILKFTDGNGTARVNLNDFRKAVIREYATSQNLPLR